MIFYNYILYLNINLNTHKLEFDEFNSDSWDNKFNDSHYKPLDKDHLEYGYPIQRVVVKETKGSYQIDYMSSNIKKCDVDVPLILKASKSYIGFEIYSTKPLTKKMFLNKIKKWFKDSFPVLD